MLKQPAKRPWLSRGLVSAGLVLAMAAVGCSTDSAADQQCLAAFRNQDPRAQPPYGVSPLDDAVKACANVDAWRRAWDAVPSAHPGRDDPDAFLAGRCAVDELAATELCRSLE